MNFTPEYIEYTNGLRHYISPMSNMDDISNLMKNATKSN